MRQWLFRLWNEEARFKQAVRGLAIGLAIALSTSAGAEIATGDFASISPEEWWRFAVATLIGTFGGSVAVGDKNVIVSGKPPLETDQGLK